MKLVDVIEYLTTTEKLKQLCTNERLNPESEALLICMKNVLSLNSEIRIFEIEETRDDLFYMKDGMKFVQFLPMNLAAKFVQMNLDGKESSVLAVAQRLLEYAINDA